MFLRRFSLAAVVFVALAVAVAFAQQPQVTVVLTNGQQYTGSLTMLNNSNVSLNSMGRPMNWATNQVAVIEFAPGPPSQQELEQVSSASGNRFLGTMLNSRNVALVLQDGQVVTGALSGTRSGNRITITTQNGQNNYFANDIVRLYPDPANARNLGNLLSSNNPGQYNQYPNAVGTTGQMPQPRTITVPANQRWTPTGIYVQQGQQLTFQASGQVQWSKDPNALATPSGATAPQQASSQYPLPEVGVGALIARVGNSQPFLIGTSTQPMTMPASGELFLGINDNFYEDNGGNFTVQISSVSMHQQ